MPGPPIAVCKDDTVIVDVINTMTTETTSMHFHGQYKIIKFIKYCLKLFTILLMQENIINILSIILIRRTFQKSSVF